MSIFNINISSFITQATPPKKRSASLLALGVGLLSAFRRKHATFIDYKEGSAAADWGTGTYAAYDQVNYNRRIYEALESTNAVPDDATKWALLLESFLGVDETQYYNGGKLQLEYGLNRFFSTTFNQPPTLSDIYITNNVQPIQPFRVGINEENSSAVGYLTSAEFVMDSYTLAAATPLFTINIPVAVHTALGADADQIIRNFADRYVASSITYDIVTY